MMTKDVDLLALEPGLFKVWRIDHQLRGKGGNGALNGTAFSAAGMDFSAAGVQAGDVLYLASIDGQIDGCYEIVNVVSPTQLTVSVIRGDDTDTPIAIGVGTNLIWRISVFAPQRALAERVLLDRLEWIEQTLTGLDATSVWRLRSAATAAAMSLIFEAVIQQDGDEEVLGRKKGIYQEAFEAAVIRLRLELDTNGDGRTDTALRGDTMRFRRE